MTTHAKSHTHNAHMISPMRDPRIIDRNVIAESSVHKGSVPELTQNGVGALFCVKRQEEPYRPPFCAERPVGWLNPALVRRKGAPGEIGPGARPFRHHKAGVKEAGHREFAQKRPQARASSTRSAKHCIRDRPRARPAIRPPHNSPRQDSQRAGRHTKTTNSRSIWPENTVLILPKGQLARKSLVSSTLQIFKHHTNFPHVSSTLLSKNWC
jgi:hypothetical protein